jgi:hypothetical protein
MQAEGIDAFRGISLGSRGTGVISRNSVVTRAAENSCTKPDHRGYLRPLPPRVFVKCLPIRRMVGRGGWNRTQRPGYRFWACKAVGTWSKLQIILTVWIPTEQIVDRHYSQRIYEPMRIQMNN